ACNVRHMLIQQGGKRPQDAALCLPSKPEKDEVLPGQNGVDDLGDDCVLETHNPREKGLARLEPADEVRAQFILYTASVETCFGVLAASAQFPQRLGKRVSCRHRMAPARPDQTGCVYSRRTLHPIRRMERNLVFTTPKPRSRRTHDSTHSPVPSSSSRV